MKVLIADKIDNEAINILRTNNVEADMKTELSENEISSIIGDYEGLIVRSGVQVTSKIIEAGKKLKVIGRAGVGVDNIDVASATNSGIVVMNTPFGNVNSAAEHTIAMMLTLSRHIHKAHYSMKNKLWERKNFQGNELRGKSIGIIGLGNVGKIVARIMQGFECVIYGYDPFVSEAAAKEMGVNPVELDFLIRNSDYITLHVPLNDKTKNMIDKKEFDAMKKGVKIINVGRGGLVNEEALYESLISGKVSGAAIDVWENEPTKDYKLAMLDNVLATPHLGASTEEAQKSVAVDIAKQVVEYLTKGIIKGAVNFHSVNSEDYETVSPYINLAEKLGSICVQLSDGGLERIEIHYRGKIADYDVRLLTSFIVKGILQNICGNIVNEVNSLFVASTRNIKVVDSKSTVTENFSNLIRVIITTDKGSYKVNGTIFDGKKERIVKINDFDIDMIPEGNLIITHNMDKPGVIGQIGTILGSNNINIARMAVGRTSRGGSSLNVTTIDGNVSLEVLDKIRNAKNVTSAVLIKV